MGRETPILSKLTSGPDWDKNVGDVEYVMNNTVNRSIIGTKPYGIMWDKSG